MIKYGYTYFHKVLLQQKSLNFALYEHITEKDLLINAFNFQEVGDYSEIDWRWISNELYGPEDYNGHIYRFDINGELEEFISHIIPRDECVRILTFLRDNCRECLFNEFYDNGCIEAFETECARLISQNIEESKRDQYHGDFAVWPRPNLKEIALAPQPKKKYSIMESEILNAIPKVPNYREVISHDTLLQAAYDFQNHFRNLVKAFEESGRDEKLKPGMSQKQHVDTINNMIIRRANRYLYGDRNPVYQVYFILGCLMGLPDHCRSWWEENFAIGIGEYLEKTNNFKGSKEKIQQVIRNILSFSQLQLDFDAPNLEKAMAEQTVQVKEQAKQQEAQRLQKPQQAPMSEEQNTSKTYPFVSNTSKTNEIIKLIGSFMHGKTSPRDVMMPIRAAINAGMIRRPTYGELQQAFPDRCPKSKASVSSYTKPDDNPYTEEAFAKMVEAFRNI